MEYLTGEYEAFIYGNKEEATLRVRMECENSPECEKDMIQTSRVGNLSPSPYV